MRVLYERCAAVDVGKDVIAVAVRLPGDGPDGRATLKRTFRTFYGVLREAARWLDSLGVTHVAMEATGIYSMPVYHALVEHGNFEQVVVCNAGHKSHAIESGMPRVLEVAGQAPLAYVNASDEHGVLRPTGTVNAPLPALDSTLWLIPGHCDPTVNLHDHMVGVAGGLAHGSVAQIYTVDARGASR